MNLYFGVTIAPYCVDLCNALHERYDCRILHWEKDAEGLAFDLPWVESLCRFPLDRYSGKPGLKAFLRTFRLIRDERPETVFVSEFSYHVLRVLLIRRLLGRRFRVISVCDDSLDMIEGNDFSRLHRLARHFVPRWLDNLVLANPGAMEWYRSHFGKGLLMPIISDENRLRDSYAAALPLAGELRERHGLGQETVVMFVGRLIPLKNLASFLRAMSGIDAVAVFVGDGTLSVDLQRLAGELGVRTVFAGRKTGAELAAWYDLADLLVLPSLQEAFGAVTGEALAAGCPVVVSRRAGSASLVREGVNGSVIDPSDIIHFSSVLQGWVSRTKPGRTLTLRNNLLPVSFAAAFDGLIRQVRGE